MRLSLLVKLGVLVLAAHALQAQAPTQAAARLPAGDVAPDDSSRSGARFEEMARMDSLMFDAAFVTCDTTKLFAMLADDVEFVHDRSGMKRGEAVREDFRRLAANCPAKNGIRRELVPGTLRVYPIAGYGVLQSGVHRFVERGAPTMTVARYVTLWRRDGDRWVGARFLSYDHRSGQPLP